MTKAKSKSVMTPEERADKVMCAAIDAGEFRDDPRLAEKMVKRIAAVISEAEEIGAASQAKWQRRHGVESGPGQPTDLINDCNDLASKYESTHPDFAVVMRKMAVEIKRIRQEAKDERRAGIEAAAQVAYVEIEKFSALHSIHPAQVRTAIRALADKPAPDQSKGG